MTTRIPSQSPTNPSVAKALARIRVDFINGLFPLINEMEHQRQILEASTEHASQALESLQRCVHRLSGIAGSIGFPEVSEQAGHLDLTLSGLGKPPFDQRDVAALQAPLDELLNLMETILDDNL